MERRWTTMILALAVAGCAVPLGDGAPPDDGFHTDSSELLSGTYTFERPEVGSIRVGGGACTATLFGSARTVITAAHCVDYRTTSSSGRYGDFTLEPRPGERYNYTISQMVSFGTTYGSSRDDVALLQLSEAVPSSVASPAAPVATHPARGTAVTIYGFGCQRRGGRSSSFAKQKFAHRWGDNTYNLCPGDSGGPTMTPSGEVIRVNSAYIVSSGQDLFGDVPTHLASLRRYADVWRGASPLVWVGDAPPPSDPPPSDPPPSDPPPSDPPPSDPPPSDPPPPPPGDSPADRHCAAHADCDSCSQDDRCGWCNGSCRGLHLDARGRIAGNGCTEPPVIAPWSCPPPGGGGGGSEPPPPAPPSPDGCGDWRGFTSYTCHADGRQLIRCNAGTIEHLYCPSGYACRPGSTELLCYWAG